MTSVGNNPPSSSSENQSIKEFVIRLVVTHIFGICIYGHFGTLADIPSGTHALNVIAFLLHPGVVYGQIWVDTLRAIMYYFNCHRGRGAPSGEFYMAGTLGVWARRLPEPIGGGTTSIDVNPSAIPDYSEDDPEISQPIPLFVAGHSKVKRITEPRSVSWAWFGRLFVSLYAVSQAVGTFVIFVRRQGRGCSLQIDMKLGLMAFTSAFIGILGLGLQLVRTKWVLVRHDGQVQHIPPTGSRWRGKYRHNITPLIFSLVYAAFSTAPITGSVLMMMGVVYPFFMVLVHPSYLALFLLVALLVWANKRRGLVKLLTLVAQITWVQYAISIALLSLVLADLVVYYLVTIGELRDAKEGCWKDPVSDLLFVI